MRSRLQSLAGIFATLAFGSTALAASSTPVGLGCSSGFALVIDSNVLTCKKQSPDTPIPVKCVNAAGAPAPVKPVAGSDSCSTGQRLTCTAGFTLKVDYNGSQDMCVKPGGVTYEAPVQK